MRMPNGLNVWLTALGLILLIALNAEAWPGPPEGSFVELDVEGVLDTNEENPGGKVGLINTDPPAVQIYDWWSFDYDDGGWSVLGGATYVATETLANIHGGYALLLDGVNGRATAFDQHALITSITDRTVSIWVKPDDDTFANGAEGEILLDVGDNADGLGIRIVTNGSDKEVEAAVANSGTVVTASVGFARRSDGWTHVVMTFDSIDANNGELKLYLNGQLVDTKTTSFGTVPKGGNWTANLGFCDSGDVFGHSGSGYYHGAVDDVRAFNVVLNAEQVKQLDPDQTHRKRMLVDYLHPVDETPMPGDVTISVTNLGTGRVSCWNGFGPGATELTAPFSFDTVAVAPQHVFYVEGEDYSDADRDVKMVATYVHDPSGQSFSDTVYLTVGPAQPKKPDLIASDDSGSSDVDDVTNKLQTTFVGTGSGGSTVTLYADGEEAGTSIVDSSGNWSVTTELREGIRSITASASHTDAVYSTDPSASLSVTIDRTRPLDVTNYLQTPDPSGNGVDLSWTNPASGFESVRLQRGIDVAPLGPHDQSNAYQGIAELFDDTDTPAVGETFYYAIFTVDLAGNFSYGVLDYRVDADSDGMPDAWEILHGLDPQAAGSGADSDADGTTDINEYLAGTDPNTSNHLLPTITRTWPPIGSTTGVAPDQTVGFIAFADNYDGQSAVTITDRFGNDISGSAVVTQNGLEIRIDPDDGDTATDSEHLSRLTQEFTIEFAGRPGHLFKIKFNVDASLPVVRPVDTSDETREIGGGRFSESFDIKLKAFEYEGNSAPASNASTRIYYSLDGSVPNQEYSGENLAISQTTVLRYVAIDEAENRGPEGKIVYYFGDLAEPPANFAVSWNSGTGKVDCSWTAVGGRSYHVYRAHTPLDIASLKQSVQEAHSPPDDLRLSSTVISGGNYADASPVFLSEVVYAVAEMDTSSGESRVGVASIVTEDLSADATVIAAGDYETAAQRAVDWLLTQQHPSGYWESVSGERIITTAEVLRAFSKRKAWIQQHEEAIRRGLAYIAGHQAKNNEQLARAAQCLRLYGVRSDRLEAQLLLRAYTKSGDELGWGVHHRYYADPLRSALGLLVFAEDDSSVTDLSNTRDLLSGLTVSGQNGTALQAVDVVAGGTGIPPLFTPARYGWVPRNRESVYVSSVVYHAIGWGRPSSSNDDWLSSQQELDAGESDEGAYGPTHPTDSGSSQVYGNLLDTVGVLNYQAVPTSKQAMAKNYLLTQQDSGGHGYWEDAYRNSDGVQVIAADPRVTALCLQGITSPQVAYVADVGVDVPHENGLKSILENRGFAVQVIGQEAIAVSDVEQADLVFISGTVDESVLSEAIIDAIQSTGSPVIACHPDVYARLGWVKEDPDPAVTSETGSTGGQTQLLIRSTVTGLKPTTPALHPLAADLSDTSATTVFSVSANVGWADIGYLNQDAALIIAYVPATSRAAVFAYEPEDSLPDGRRTSGRRIGLFVQSGGQSLGDYGIDLVDAAILWASNRIR